MTFKQRLKWYVGIAIICTIVEMATGRIPALIVCGGLVWAMVVEEFRRMG